MIAFELVLTAAAFGAFAYAGALIALTYWAGTPALDGSPRPATPPVMILVTAAALLGVVCALRGASGQTLAIVAVALGVLVAIWCVDVIHGIVPDVLTLVPLAAVIIAALLTGRWFVILAAAVPALPFAIMAIRTRGMGLGWGDVKLVALGGALLGMQTAILAFALAAAGAIVFAYLRRRTSEPIAFGPYLVTAIALPLAIITG